LPILLPRHEAERQVVQVVEAGHGAVVACRLPLKRAQDQLARHPLQRVGVAAAGHRVDHLLADVQDVLYLLVPPGQVRHVGGDLHQLPALGHLPHDAGVVLHVGRVHRPHVQLQQVLHPTCVQQVAPQFQLVQHGGRVHLHLARPQLLDQLEEDAVALGVEVVTGHQPLYAVQGLRVCQQGAYYRRLSL
jgi:hypothetical protein